MTKAGCQSATLDTQGEWSFEIHLQFPHPLLFAGKYQKSLLKKASAEEYLR